ncbi:unnamed protein product [Caenorhabditis auriculariae]|uniref:Endonuclease/exonuclease/phosphatase domain-containing protein n=1 Tax=Caenorhabditis auriculariae TaxID=2777116 RepID=A0A8S1HDY9_9PELO|nr:unnamed protein product [Caenorhabditis auriculariae]
MSVPPRWCHWIFPLVGKPIADTSNSPSKAFRVTSYATTRPLMPQSSARRLSSSTTSGEASTDEGRSNLGVTGCQKNGPRTRHGDCLRFGTLNCRTLATEAALEQLLAANRKANIDVICIQETKAQTETCSKTLNGELLILGKKVDGKNIGNVGFLVNRSIQPYVVSHVIMSPRLGILRLDLGARGKVRSSTSTLQHQKQKKPYWTTSTRL